jgi:hypothetical protein
MRTTSNMYLFMHLAISIYTFHSKKILEWLNVYFLHYKLFISHFMFFHFEWHVIFLKIKASSLQLTLSVYFTWDIQVKNKIHSLFNINFIIESSQAGTNIKVINLHCSGYFEMLKIVAPEILTSHFIQPMLYNMC